MMRITGDMKTIYKFETCFFMFFGVFHLMKQKICCEGIV